MDRDSYRGFVHIASKFAKKKNLRKSLSLSCFLSIKRNPSFSVQQVLHDKESTLIFISKYY
jgi:hypothetical protein